MGGLAAEKLFHPITKRLTPEELVERRLQLPDYAVDDETLNWGVLPFNEAEEEEDPPEGGPDYGLSEEDIPLEENIPEEDILPEKSLLPDLEDGILPGEKQGPLAGPSTSASSEPFPLPPYSLPYSPPACPKGRRKKRIPRALICLRLKSS